VRQKVAASTLVEVIVAMVIASISFLLAAGFFWQIAVGSFYRKPMKAEQLAVSLLNQTMAEEAFVSGAVENEVYRVERIVEAYRNTPSLLLVHIRVLTTDDRILSEAKQLVYVEVAK
jgi:Tfp pilus assembly protein PilV